MSRDVNVCVLFLRRLTYTTRSVCAWVCVFRTCSCGNAGHRLVPPEAYGWPLSTLKPVQSLCEPPAIKKHNAESQIYHRVPARPLVMQTVTRALKNTVSLLYTRILRRGTVPRSCTTQERTRMGLKPASNRSVYQNEPNQTVRKLIK